MAEQQATTPSDVASAPSFEDKMSSIMGFDSPEKPEAEPAQASDEAPQDGDDLGLLEIEPEEELAPSSDEFELIHHGQQVKVSKEQAKNLAQMGYDYSQKMEAVNADKAKIQQVAQALQAQATMQGALLEHAAVVKSYDMALAKFQGVNWVQASQDDPIGYSQARAQYDALMEQRNGAYSQMANAYAHHQQASGYVSAEVRNLEVQKLQARIPEWRDPARYAKEAPEVFRGVLQEYGFAPDELNGSPVLEDHRAVAIMRDALKYRQAVAASKGKKMNGLPGVAKPGVSQRAPNKTGDLATMTKILHQTKDPARKKQAFDAVMAKKIFG